MMPLWPVLLQLRETANLVRVFVLLKLPWMGGVGVGGKVSGICMYVFQIACGGGGERNWRKCRSDFELFIDELLNWSDKRIFRIWLGSIPNDLCI